MSDSVQHPPGGEEETAAGSGGGGRGVAVWRRVAAWTLLVSGGLGVVVTLLPLIPTGAWYVRGWDFPRLQVAVVLTAIVCGLPLLRGAFSVRWVVGWSVVIGGAAMFQWSHVVRYTPLWPHEVPDVGTAAEGGGVTEAGISVLTVNVNFENRAYERVVSQLRAIDADVLVLIEIDEAWRRGLSPLESRYPHRKDVVASEGLGLCLWSRVPMSSAEVRFLVEDRRPSLWARLDHPSGRIDLVAVHPTPPGLKDSTGEERRDSRTRDAELVLIAREVADRGGNWIVAGDFNDVAWSHTTRLFKRLGGLGDPRVGRSFMGTFHADYPPFRFPIDHVFLSDGFRMLELRRHEIHGSDHFAMWARMALANPAAGVSPEPEGNDRADAAEIVEEGQEEAAERGIADEAER